MLPTFKTGKFHIKTQISGFHWKKNWKDLAILGSHSCMTATGWIHVMALQQEKDVFLCLPQSPPLSNILQLWTYLLSSIIMFVVFQCNELFLQGGLHLSQRQYQADRMRSPWIRKQWENLLWEVKINHTNLILFNLKYMPGPKLSKILTHLWEFISNINFMKRRLCSKSMLLTLRLDLTFHKTSNT